jgi:hypothetical protein
MPLNPFEIEFIKAFASDPNEHARYIMSPNVNAGTDWLPSPLGKKFISAIGNAVVCGLPITPVNIVSYSDLNLGKMSTEEMSEFIAVWKSASKESVDITEAVKRIRNEVVTRGANDAIVEYQASIQKAPSRVIDHVDALTGRLSILSNDGVDYDPSSVAASREPVMIRQGTWGNVVFDEMFSAKGKEDRASSGIPQYGFTIASMPTKHGKSTLGISLMAGLIAYGGMRGLIMSNELPRAMYAQPIRKALGDMYAGTIPDNEIDDIMEDRLKIYAPSTDHTKRGVSVKTFEQMQRIIRFTSPQFAIMDSINSITPPAWAARMDELSQHQKKAESFRDMCLDRQIIMYCPGNMSEGAQKILRSSKPDEMSSVVLYGSKEYEGCCDFAFVGWRDREMPGVVYIRRTANRHGTSMGEKWTLKYNPIGGYYTPYF